MAVSPGLESSGQLVPRNQSIDENPLELLIRVEMSGQRVYIIAKSRIKFLRPVTNLFITLIRYSKGRW